MTEIAAGGRRAGSPEPPPVRPFRLTHATMFRIAVPMMFAYLTVPLAGAIDTTVIGQLGDAALLGGIAVGAVVLDVVFTTFNFLRSGTTGLTAQAMGASDEKEMAAVLLRAMLVALVSGIVIVILRRPVAEIGAMLMDPGAGVVAPMRDYVLVRLWASPFGLANYALLGWLLGLGRSLTVLAVQLAFAVINIVLSVWLVLGLGYGVQGVAWASVLAEIATVAIEVPIVLALVPRDAWPSPARIFERAGFMRLIGVNRDIMIRSFALLFAFAFFTRQGAHYGAVVLAANAVLMHFFIFGGYFLDGFATAAEQLAGRAVGARYRPAFERVVRLTTLWGAGTGVALSLVYLVFGAWIIDLTTTAPEVRETARHYLVWAVATPIAGAVAFQMDGVFIGATWSRDMRNMMLLSVLVFLIAWAALTPAFGNHGLWLALLIFLGARSLTFHWRARRLLPATFRS